VLRDWNRPCLIVDVDGTLCPTRLPDQSYANLPPIIEVIERLRQYHAAGWYIIIHTARQERTYDGNIGQRTAHMLPVLIEWLDRHHVPYDEIRIDKPWYGFHGFALDDKTVPPKVFIEQTSEEILQTWLPIFAVK